MPTIPNTNPLRSSLDLSQGLPDLETRLLPQFHDLESLEICQSPSPLLLGTLLRPGALLPLRVDTSLLPLRLDYASSCASWKFLQYEGSEDEFCEGDRLTGNGGLGIC